MTIENYFERRIRPIVEDNKQRNSTSYDGVFTTGTSSTARTTSGHTEGSRTEGSHTAGYAARTTSQSPSQTNSGIIDEDQLNRTFQEIVNCINLDDDSEEDKAMTMFSSQQRHSYNENVNFSRSSLNFNHAHHSLLPEFNSIFGGSKSSFNAAVGSGSGNGETVSVPKKITANGNSANLGKSFLDDDWFPREYEQIKSRPITPASTIISSSPSSRTSNVCNTSSSSVNNEYYHSNGSNNNSNSHSHAHAHAHNNNNFIGNPPPTDYVCKLCNCDGHWMKDCRLYEPRTPPSSISSFKSTFSSASNGSSSSNNNNSSSSAIRTLMPPGNYVCRLCNVSGHWIDQCSKFQPKHLDSINPISNNLSSNTAPILPPMLGPGPTPNYRPPAYLSKPVPSNYLCNLCNRPGHWIQQCSEFTPIITHKPRM